MLPAELHAVTFQVAFVNDVQAVVVAQVEEPRIVGVMRGANGVQVVLFHQQNIGPHGGERHGFAGLRMMVVAVGPFDFYGRAVDQENAVFDLDFPEAHFAGGGFEHFACGVLDCQEQSVQMRRFSRPFQGGGHGGLSAPLPLRLPRPLRCPAQAPGQRGAVVGIQQARLHPQEAARTPSAIPQPGVDAQNGVPRNFHPVRSARKNRADKSAAGPTG